MSAHDRTSGVTMFYSWTGLVIVHWLLISVLLNLGTDFRMELYWGRIRWDEVGFHSRYIFTAAALAGVLISVWAWIGHQICLSSGTKRSICVSILGVLLCCVPLLFAGQVIDAEISASKLLRIITFYDSRGEPIYDELLGNIGWRSWGLERTGPAVLLLSLSLLFPAVVPLKLNLSLLSFLRAITWFAVLLAVARGVYSFPWVWQWSNLKALVLAATILSSSALPIFLTNRLDCLRRFGADGLTCGFWTIVLLSCIYLSTIWTWDEHRVHAYPIVLVGAFSITQVLASVLRRMDKMPSVLAKPVTSPVRLTEKYVSWRRATIRFITLVVSSQWIWSSFADRYNPTMLLLSAEHGWKEAAFVADLKRFHLRTGVIDERLMGEYSIKNALNTVKGNVNCATATRTLVGDRQWPKFQERLLGLNADAFWVHAYPVADPSYFNTHHECSDIDGRAILAKDWPSILDGAHSPFETIHSARVGPEDFRRIPPKLRSVTLVNPEFSSDFDAALTRELLPFSIHVEKTSTLLTNPRMLLELAHNEANIFINQENPEVVLSQLRAVDPLLGDWLDINGPLFGKCYITPALKIVGGTCPPNQSSNLLSTNTEGNVVGCRLSLLGVETSEFLKAIDIQERLQLNWLHISPSSLRDLQKSKGGRKLVSNVALIIGQRKDEVFELRQAFVESAMNGLMRCKAIQFVDDFGYERVATESLQNWPWLTTLFLWDPSVEFREHYLSSLLEEHTLKRVVLICTPRSIEQLNLVDARCDAIHDGPVNITKLFASVVNPSERWIQLLREVPFEVIAVPSSISNDEKVKLIWDE